MNEAIIAAIITGGFELMRIHQNKPEGWKPSQAEVDAFLLEVDNATTENRMAAARERLRIPPAEQDTPQAPVN